MLSVYLTDLAAYNNGFLVGEWITLPMDETELSKAIQGVLAAGSLTVHDSVHEEYFITDFMWSDISLFEVDEYENIEELNSNLTLLEDCSEYQLKAIAFLLSEGITMDLEDAFYRSDDVVIHSESSMEDIAYDLLQECYGVDKLAPIIANNIDYYSIGEELEMDGNFTLFGGDVYEYIG